MSLETGETKAFQMEKHGIDIVPEQYRYGSPRSLFWVWMAGQLTISGIIMGQLFTTLGLSLYMALGVCLFCGLTYIVVGLSGTPGPRAGTATLAISRASFGVKGNALPSFLSWLNLVGWESVTIVLTVEAVLALGAKFGIPSTGVGPTLIGVVVAVVLTFSVPILGHATVIVMQRYLSYAVGVLAILMTILLLPKVDFGFHPAASSLAASGIVPTLVLAAAIGVMGSSMTWTNYAADYSRYLHTKTSSKAIIWYTTLGGGIAGFLFQAIGVLLGTFINPAAFSDNPVSAMGDVLPAWYAIPFLLVVILGQVANNYLNSYSSAMSFLAIGIRMKRYISVIVDATLAVIVGCYALFFSPGFIGFFIQFLSLSIVFIGPWTGIYLVHHWINKGQYYSEDLVVLDKSSRYWYSSGVNYKAYIALILGAAAAFMCVNSTLWVSPFSTQVLFGMDLSPFVGPLVAGIIYAVLPVSVSANKKLPTSA
ncbi:cytosine permease [Paenibacillus sp. GP183]|uniref:purine-cytosine permease family protein n=1 Tax=Paenibacillus sp. GP183 TaxID=1882751 RepID=UPI00089D7B57|nr:cytosine permease [Paenibacillus sp. GP183]SEC80481.1 Purine-cytosine permease [Paenibacillus sp. GP183]